MKIIYIVRHAKSGWDNPELSDFERPLTDRGNRDAAAMAVLVGEQQDPPTAILTSSALRAVTTARIFSEHLGLPLASMIITNELYEATTRDTLEAIHTMDQGIERLMVVGHNPTQTSVVNLLSDKAIDELPTCAVVKIAFPDAKHWSDVQQKSGKMLWYESPKK